MNLRVFLLLSMKQFLILSILLLSFNAKGQDITDFFRSAPLPYDWRMLPETKEQLIRYGKLSEEYREKLSQTEGIDHYFESNLGCMTVDKENAYLCVNYDSNSLTMCYWVQTNEDEKYYLIAVQVIDCSSPGCYTSSIDFFIYRNKQYYSCYPINENQLYKVLAPEATRQQLDLIGLTYELPQKGKDIIARIDFFEGEGVDRKQVEITKQSLKGNTVKLTYWPDYFEVGEPYFESKE